MNKNIHLPIQFKATQVFFFFFLIFHVLALLDETTQSNTDQYIIIKTVLIKIDNSSLYRMIYIVKQQYKYKSSYTPPPSRSHQWPSWLITQPLMAGRLSTNQGSQFFGGLRKQEQYASSLCLEAARPTVGGRRRRVCNMQIQWLAAATFGKRKGGLQQQHSSSFRKKEHHQIAVLLY